MYSLEIYMYKNKYIVYIMHFRETLEVQWCVPTKMVGEWIFIDFTIFNHVHWSIICADIQDSIFVVI